MRYCGLFCLEPPDSDPSPGTLQSSEFLALDSAETITWDKVQSQEKQRNQTLCDSCNSQTEVRLLYGLLILAL